MRLLKVYLRRQGRCPLLMLWTAPRPRERRVGRSRIERQRPAPGLIHHSDRGIQYAAEAYRQALAGPTSRPR